jgi:hypothetical protein
MVGLRWADTLTQTLKDINPVAIMMKMSFSDFLMGANDINSRLDSQE